MENKKSYKYEVELIGTLFISEDFEIEGIHFTKSDQKDKKGKIIGYTDIKNKKELSLILKKYCGYISLIFSILSNSPKYIDFNFDELKLFSETGGFTNKNGVFKLVEGLFHFGRVEMLAKKKEIENSALDVNQFHNTNLQAALYWYHEALASKYDYQSIVFLDAAIEAIDFYRISHDQENFYLKLNGVYASYFTKEMEKSLKHRFSNIGNILEYLYEIHKARILFVHKGIFNINDINNKFLAYEHFVRSCLYKIAISVDL